MGDQNRIMRQPLGLLSFFDTKSLGKTPPQFEDELRVVANMYEHYLPTPEYSVNTTTGAAAIGVFDTHTVPNTEAWVVRALHFNIARSAAGGLLRIAIQAAVPANANGFGMGESAEATFAGLVSEGLTTTWNGTMLFGPGSTFFGQIQTIPGGTTVNTTMGVLRHVLRV